MRHMKLPSVPKRIVDSFCGPFRQYSIDVLLAGMCFDALQQHDQAQTTRIMSFLGVQCMFFTLALMRDDEGLRCCLLQY